MDEMTTRQRVALFVALVLAVAGILAIVLGHGTADAAPRPANCAVNVNGHQHELRTGQLLSYPDAQVLCVNGDVKIELHDHSDR